MGLKNLFFKDSGEPEVKVKEQPKKAPPASIVGNMGMGSYVAQPIIPLPSSGTDYNKHLDGVMKKSNQPGPDYFEFSQALTSLDGQPLSEQQKYIATFPTYAAMGITPEKLVESARAYLKILQQEKSDFEGEMNATRKANVTDKQAKIALLEKDILNLTKQIQDKNAEIQKLNVEVNTATNTLSSEGMSFQNALDNRMLQINDHITKIQNYLHATNIK